jgi:hypothetical protein
MTGFFGFKQLRKIDDWPDIVGRKNWRAKASAYELAHSWHESSGLPAPISTAIQLAGHRVLHGLTLDLCVVEKPVFLDTRIAPSMTDLMGYGRNEKGEEIVIAVEGKADEPFALPVRAWVKGDSLNPPVTATDRPTRLRRLEFLSKHLGHAIPSDSPLRYQLLHRTVSAVLEAQLHGAAAALVLVHSFGPDAGENFVDFRDFVRKLGGDTVEQGSVLGPLELGENRDLPTFFLWWQQAAKD